MTRISVTESGPKPKADATETVRGRRRKLLREKRAERDEMHKEVPRYVRDGRIMVTLNPSPTVLRECPECGYEPWKWQTECPKCGATLPVEEE